VTQPPSPEGGGPDRGSVRPTPPAVPALAICFGLVGGWSIRPVLVWLGLHPPVVTWMQVATLVLVAAMLATTAWVTWRQLRVHHRRIEPHQAVNRLVMAQACIVAGALVAGGFGGYAVSWLGIEAEFADERIVRSLCAMLAGLVITCVAIWLERACRVRGDDDADLA
jgi:hypothetical protein